MIELVGPRGHRWRVEEPGDRRERTRGLRGKGSLPTGYGMLFRRCRSVHTFGMAFPIAVVRLDRDLRVLGVHRMPPRRLLLPRPGTRHILECAPEAGLRTGDELRSVPPGG